jgi:hypothetical protein
MTLRRSVRAGNSINLRAQMLDDLQAGATASGVSVYIFNPENTTTDYLISEADYFGNPTHWENGIFEYSFTPPDESESDGIWTDLWYGTINEQTVSGIFTFEVSANGTFQSIAGQLNPNNIVNVKLYSGIAATDGSELQSDYEFSFLTEVAPKYTDLTKVMIEVGSAIDGLSDMTIYLAILEASLEANAMTFNTTTQNTTFFNHARREWTTCRAAAMLASNVRGRYFLKSKNLGDLQVSYDNGSLDDLLDRIAACLENWKPQLISGGYGTRDPAMFIKGWNDPDRPTPGRLWISNQDGDYFTRNMPVSNRKVRPNGKRRWKEGYTKRNKGGRW